MLLFVFVYLVEATIRKYLFPATLIILVKYVPLYYYVLKHNRYRDFIYYILLGIPLISTTDSVVQIPYAIYDFNVTILIPVISLLVIQRLSIPERLSNQILSLGWIGGILNSVVIILQALLGSKHWISQTVDQQFSQHVYKTGGLLQKAPGIAASPSPFITIAGLIAVALMMNRKVVSKPLLWASMLIMLASILFNLQSRTYSLGIGLFLFFQYLLPLANTRRISQNIVPLLSISAFIIMSLVIILPLIPPDLINENRTTSDFDSVTGRFVDFYPVDKLNFSVPLLHGLGLGSTVNNNPYTYLNPEAFNCNVEYEYPRLICAFGLYGFLIILSRFWAALDLLKRSLSLISSCRFSEASGYTFIVCSVFMAAQYKINDTAAGLLLISIVSRATAFAWRNNQILPSHDDNKYLKGSSPIIQPYSSAP